MKFIDLFAGIGGFRMGMERAGHECVGYVEIDKFARKSYEAIYDTEGEWTKHDITKVTDEEWHQFRGGVDVLCGGFPCQAFSIAGKRRGFADETRGTLFFEVARAAKEIQPSYLFLENVKGLLNHDKGRTFRTILSTLDECGYDVEWQLCNSKNFGVPQNRERVIIIGHLRGASTREVFFDAGQSRQTTGSNVVKVSRDYKGPKQVAIKQVGNISDRKSFGGNPQVGRVYDPEGLSPTLNTMTGGGREPKIIDNRGVVTEDLRIRKLTPRECWRLQGFPDWAFDKAQEFNSNSQLYKQAGNSVTVPLIYEMARRMEVENES